MTGRPTWLVTGARGFLGANLGEYLSGQVDRIGAVRDPSESSGLFDSYVGADLRQTDVLESVIEQVRPDVIVHAAAIASHEACEADPTTAEQINALATGVLADAAHRHGSRFVLISTDAVFDGARGGYAESDEPSPTSVYGATKLQGERLATAHGDPLIVRTNFFGWSPTGKRSILEFFVNELSAGRTVRGFTDFSTTSAYVQVLADVIWRLVESEMTGIFHVTSPDALSKFAFGVAVAEEFGLATDLIMPTKADVQPPRGRNLSLDVTKVQAALGMSSPAQLDGIRRARRDAHALRQRIRGPAEA